jgi:PhoH-like ATPase
MEPWMGALMDNLEVLTQSRGAALGPRGHQRPAAQPHQDPLAELHARPHLPEPLRHPRRSPEPHAEADEGAVTRAGPGTKIVCLGNIAQIDTPYLTETTSGLTYVVNRFRGWPHSGHITLRARRTLQAR